MANDMDFALSMFNNAIDLGTQMAASDLNYKNSKRLMKYQTELNRQNWNMQNEYNEMLYNKYSSPSAMVKQYKDAGLNPAAIAGGPSAQVAEADVSGTSLGTAAPIHPNFNVLSGVAQLAQIRHVEAQTENLDANTKKTLQDTDQSAQMFPLLMDAQELQNGLTRAETALANSRAFNEDARTAWQNIQNEIAAATKDNQIQMSEEQLNTMIANLRIVRAQAFEAEKRNEHIDEVIAGEIDLMTANAALMRANAAFAEQQTETEKHNTKIAEYNKFMMDRANWRDLMRMCFEAREDENGEKRILVQLREEYQTMLEEQGARREVAEHNSNDFKMWLETLSTTGAQAIGVAGAYFLGKGKKARTTYRGTSLYGPDGKPAVVKVNEF